MFWQHTTCVLGRLGLGVALRIVLTHGPKGFPSSQFGIASTLQNETSKWHECPTQASCEKSQTCQTRGFAHSSDLFPILIRSVAPGLQSVTQLISLFQEATCVSILGACSLRVFLTILAARLLAFEDAITSCFVPDCWVGTLSVLRAQTLECDRDVPIPHTTVSNLMLSASLTP